MTRSSRFPMFCASLALASLAASAAPAGAQDGRQPVPHAQTISANPFLMMVEWFNVEYERKLSESVTLGGAASTIGIGDVDHSNVNALIRYYPQNTALTGVYFGGRTGFARLSEAGVGGEAFSAGFELGYSWLFGTRRNVGINLGGGVDRLFGADLDGFTLYRPIAKLNVGFAF